MTDSWKSYASWIYSNINQAIQLNRSTELLALLTSITFPICEYVTQESKKRKEEKIEVQIELLLELFINIQNCLEKKHVLSFMKAIEVLLSPQWLSSKKLKTTMLISYIDLFSQFIKSCVKSSISDKDSQIDLPIFDDQRSEDSKIQTAAIGACIKLLKIWQHRRGLPLQSRGIVSSFNFMADKDLSDDESCSNGLDSTSVSDLVCLIDSKDVFESFKNGNKPKINKSEEMIPDQVSKFLDLCLEYCLTVLNIIEQRAGDFLFQSEVVRVQN